MNCHTQAACWRICRTLHECVDWNVEILTVAFVEQGRTLHECVDWNFVVFVAFLQRSQSHSTRVRGLKSRSYGMGSEKRFVALYTSAWIEIPLRNGARRTMPVALYTSAWIEISELWAHDCALFRRTLHECVDWNRYVDALILVQVQSHSTRVRGLKLVGTS